MKIIQSFMLKYGKYMASASLSLAMIISVTNCRYFANQPEEPAELKLLCKQLEKK